jgi:hypothetical protein
MPYPAAAQHCFDVHRSRSAAEIGQGVRHRPCSLRRGGAVSHPVPGGPGESIPVATTGGGAPKGAAVSFVPRARCARTPLGAPPGQVCAVRAFCGDFSSRAPFPGIRPDPLPVRGASSAHRLVAPWSVHRPLGRPVQRSSSRRGRHAPRAGFRNLPGAGLRTPPAGAASHPALACVS